MKLQKTLIAALLTVYVAGCTNNNNPPAAATPPSPSQFEKAKDPPINARTHFAAAQVCASEGRMQEAVDQCKAALKLDPHYDAALFQLGILYVQMRDYSNAIETWNRYIDATGGSATSYNNMGFCQELAGDPAAAEAAYKKGIAKDPGNEPCRVNYGLMLARHGRPTEALLQLQSVLPPAQAHYDLASVQESLGHKEQARAEYNKAIELDPKFEDAKARLAKLN